MASMYRFALFMDGWVMRSKMMIEKINIVVFRGIQRLKNRVERMWYGLKFI